MAKVGRGDIRDSVTPYYMAHNMWTDFLSEM